MIGTVIIQCEDNKAIFNIEEKDDGTSDIKVTFEPNIDMNKEEVSESESFVTYIASLLIEGLNR